MVYAVFHDCDSLQTLVTNCSTFFCASTTSTTALALPLLFAARPLRTTAAVFAAAADIAGLCSSSVVPYCCSRAYGMRRAVLLLHGLLPVAFYDRGSP